MMLNRRCRFLLLIFPFVLSGCEKDRVDMLTLEQVLVGTEELNLDGAASDGMPVDRSITLLFSQTINPSTAGAGISLLAENQAVDMEISFSNQGNRVILYPVGVLNHHTTYTLQVSDQLRASDGSGIHPQTVS